MYANEEVKHMLGFNPKDIINKSVNCLMPTPIAMAHDYFIQRYFETAKSKVIDTISVKFAVNN